jgi:hypothetical protein
VVSDVDAKLVAAAAARGVAAQAAVEPARCSSAAWVPWPARRAVTEGRGACL